AADVMTLDRNQWAARAALLSFDPRSDLVRLSRQLCFLENSFRLLAVGLPHCAPGSTTNLGFRTQPFQVRRRSSSADPEKSPALSPHPASINQLSVSD